MNEVTVILTLQEVDTLAQAIALAEQNPNFNKVEVEKVLDKFMDAINATVATANTMQPYVDALDATFGKGNYKWA